MAPRPDSPVELEGEGERLEQAGSGPGGFRHAHPARGALVLEVKGGGIAWDPDTDAWTSTDGTGETWPITDPFRQAQRLSRLLGQMLGFKGPDKDRPTGEAVCFPNCTVSSADLLRTA